jgi:hypothetical protein
MCIYSANAHWRGRQDKKLKISQGQRTQWRFEMAYSRTSAQSIPMMRFSANRFSDFGKIK